MSYRSFYLLTYLLVMLPFANVYGNKQEETAQKTEPTQETAQARETEPPQVTAPAGETAPAQEETPTKPSDPKAIPPFKEGLVSVPIPNLNLAEEVVAKQIRRFYSSLVTLIRTYPEASTEISNAYGLLGDVFSAYKIRVSAEACYENAHHLAPEQFRWLYLLAALNQEQGDIEIARDYLLEASKLKENYLPVWVRLGDLVLQFNKKEEARGFYQKALALNPNDPAALFGMGEVALLDKEYKEAIPHFEKALALVPVANRIHYSLMMAYRGLGEMDKARNHMNQSGKIGVRVADPLLDGIQRYLRGERVHLIRGKAAFGAGHYQNAAEEFAKAVRSKPDSLRAQLNLGTTLGLLNRTEEALTIFQAVLKQDATNQTAQYNTGFLFSKMQKYPEAEQHLRKALKLNPEDTTALMVLGGVLYKTGKYEEALKHYDKVIQTKSLDEEHLINRASILVNTKDLAGAKQCLLEGHELMPQSGPLSHVLARFLASCPDEKLRDGLLALNLAKKVHKASPTVEHTVTLALAFAEVGDCEVAALWQEKAVAAARTAKDTALVQRLQEPLTRYQTGHPCRPPFNNP